MFLLGISGSLRAGSVNSMLIRNAARLIGAARFEEAHLRLPLYDGDLEDAEGVPAAVEALVELIENADAVIISTPEYNGNMPGGLKNALDWISRSGGKPFAGKPVAIMSAAAGIAGGIRAQNSLRLALTSFSPRLLSGREVSLGMAADKFDANGLLTSKRVENDLKALMERLKAEIS